MREVPALQHGRPGVVRKWWGRWLRTSRYRISTALPLNAQKPGMPRQSGDEASGTPHPDQPYWAEQSLAAV